MNSNAIQARFRLERPGFTLDVDLTLPGHGVSALFGQSGSGKTTCLRALAGLERPPGGYCAVAGEVWQDDARGLFVPPHRRAIGYVFQEASLFPHLNARGNMEFGQKRAPQSAGPDTPAFSLEAVADLLGIAHLLERRPEELSGGERQRVAIGRALLANPRLLLMDEPLAALDLKRKQEILPYLERLHDELAIPMVYVSHAPDEVARLADHLVLLADGRAVASGPLADTLCRLDLPPAFSDNVGTVVTATVAEHEADDLTRLEFPGGYVHVSRRREAIGQSLRCRIHARDVSLALVPPVQSSIVNCLPAVVESLAPADEPGHVLVRLQAGPSLLLARITRRSAETLGLRPGLSVFAQIKSVALLA